VSWFVFLAILLASLAPLRELVLAKDAGSHQGAKTQRVAKVNWDTTVEVPLGVSVDLRVSVVEFLGRQFTTEAQRSTERHKGNSVYANAGSTRSVSDGVSISTRSLPLPVLTSLRF
jgi:hypothetical protein